MNSLALSPGLGTKRYYVLLTITTALIGILAYGLLPLAGIELPGHLLGISNVWMLAILGMLGFAYLSYLGLVDRKPEIMAVGVAVFLPLFFYMLDQLQAIGLPVRPLVTSAALITVPAILMSRKPLGFLWKNVPHFRFYAMFCGLVVIYYFFNNANIIDYNYAKDAESYGTYAQGRFSSILILFAIQIYMGKTFLQAQKPGEFFRKLNLIFAIYLILFSLSAIVFYALDIMTVNIDGKRLQHIMIHPGAFSQYMSFVEIYLVSVYFYYKNLPGTSKGFVKLLFVACILVFCGLLCGVTKTFIFSTTMSVLLVIFGTVFLESRQQAFQEKLKTLFKVGFVSFATAVVLIAGLTFSGITSVLAERVENSESQDWRFTQWERITSDMRPLDLLFVGNGLTAAIGRSQTMTYNTQNIAKNTQESSYIHNSYIEHVYDFGLPGLCWFLGLLLLFGKSIGKFMSKKTPIPDAVIYLGLSCLVINFLISVGNTEDFFQMHNPFWYSLTIMYLMISSVQKKYVQ